MNTRGSVTTARRGPGGRRKGDRRREAILEAVERLLRDRSIAELAVEEIAAAAGISRSGFYFYFESKYAALGDALTDVWEEMALAADAFFGGTDEPPRDYVPRALERVAVLWERHEALLTGMFEASASDPGVRALWDAWIGRFVEVTAERIEVERARGRALPGPPDAHMLARALLLMTERVLYDGRRRRLSGDESSRAVEALTGVWLASVWGERIAPSPA